MKLSKKNKTTLIFENLCRKVKNGPIMLKFLDWINILSFFTFFFWDQINRSMPIFKIIV